MVDAPGVYVREVPAGPGPIAGVSTSVAAVVGSTRRGPVNRPVRVTSLGDFERVFGTTVSWSEAGHAARHFFLNGGSALIVVRVTDSTARAATVETLGLASDALTVTARSVGAWGNAIHVAVARAAEATAPTTFDMVVRVYDGTTVMEEETFKDLSITEGDPRYVETVLAAESRLITAAHMPGALSDPGVLDCSGTVARGLDDLLAAPPTAFVALSGGSDGVVPGDPDWAGVMKDTLVGSEVDRSGLFALTDAAAPQFNTLMLPDAAGLDRSDSAQEAAMVAVYQQAYVLCEEMGAFLVVDPTDDLTQTTAIAWRDALGEAAGRNAAMYYPMVREADAVDPSAQSEMRRPSGIVAGIFARTDATRGVWKAPAGTEAQIVGAMPVDRLTDDQQATLNAEEINALRVFPRLGPVVWGARTLQGADRLGSDWKYINVRRLGQFLERSLEKGLQWVVFEPNGEALWAAIRLSAEGFMQTNFASGAFQGASPREAYFVKCDETTTTQADIDLGVVNIEVGFAPLRPAEFVIIRIQQRAASPN